MVCIKSTGLDRGGPPSTMDRQLALTWVALYCDGGIEPAMRGEGIQIGKIYGIPIFLHTSWFLIFGLIAFWFYSDFDALHLNLPMSRLVGLGIMTSLLFFGSLVFHE